MINLQIPYNKLQLVEYEGAGNRTPVLDISCVNNISDYSVEQVRTFLESDLVFRVFLQQKGLAVQADSVMIFYKTNNTLMPFVTFIGEPGAGITSPFSDMCGNGIRSLALHIFLAEQSETKRNEYLHKGITIFAGELRTIQIESIDYKNRSGFISVDLGPYQREVKKLSSFINPELFSKHTVLSNIPFNGQAPDLHNYTFSFGFNGNTIGEPHLTIFVKNQNVEPQEIITFLRTMATKLGNRLTFDSLLFPKGVNVNIAMEHEGRIFVSTHERNLSPNQKTCLEEINNQICRCNTLACGTGGAAVSNEAIALGIIAGNTVITVHPGGCITYQVTPNTTIMTGPARQL
jgi:diaminopimelate epimerase